MVGVGESGDFDHWLLQQEMVALKFDTVRDKSDLELALRRAQLALLNPENEHTRYLKLAAPALGREKLQVDFSPNIISLKITGENLPELSLYDLPGAINSLGDEDQQYLVHFVEKLMKVYIRDTSAIILLACPANQDLETSTTYRYLTDCAGARKRTMGVLTKPDLVETTSSKLEYLQQILNGQKFSVGYGWHVTRQLSQSELDRQLSYGQARQVEAGFFAKAPWAYLAPATDRFGVPSLQKALSKVLTVEIIKVIPSIMANAQERIAEIHETLQKFPAKAAAPVQTVFEEAEKVTRALIEELDTDSNKPFRKHYREVFNAFWKKIKESKPTVVLSTPGYKRPTILVDDESDEMDATPSKRQNTGRATPACTPSSSRTTVNGALRRRTPAPPTDTLSGKVVFRLDNVKTKYDLAAGAVLGGSLDSKITRQLMLSTVKVWNGLVQDLLRTVHTMFDRLLDETIRHVLASRYHQELFRIVLQESKSLLTMLMEEQKVQATRMVGWEQVRPLTYNGLMLKDKKFAYEADLRKRRDDHRISEHYDTMEAEGCSVPKVENRKKAGDKADVNAFCGGPDPYDRELSAEAIPVVLAYYDVTAMSFVDGIAKSLEYLLFLPYQDRIHAQLIQGLRVGDAENCARLLADNPQREAKRAELLQEEARLHQAIEELQKLPGFSV